MCLVAAVIAFGCAAPSDRTEARASALGGDSALRDHFMALGQETGVPAEILAAISYSETRLRPVPDDLGHVHSDAGAPVPIEEAAWELADAAWSAEPRDLADWIQVVRQWRGAALADDVARHLARGFQGRDAEGRMLVVSARPVGPAPERGVGRIQQALGFPGAIWNPAHGSNYSAGSRGAASINYIVIHTVQGSYGGAISWFQNSTSNVSSHYVVRSSDGEVTQMVDDSDVAWHDACFNSETIGIEHEGYVGDPAAWYTEALYMESAKLTAWLADQYGVPKDRDHIFGHGEAPDCSSHTDPGSGWDWDHYMALVGSAGTPVLDATFADHYFPAQMESGEEAVVWFEFENGSNITWGLDATRLGTAEPRDRESPFYVDGNWLSPGRPTGADHSSYSPGSVGRFTFMIKAPEVDEPTTFTESYRLVQEGVDWFGPVATATVTVVPPGWDGSDDDSGESGDPAGGSEPDHASPGESDAGLSGGCAAGGRGSGTGAGLALLLAAALVRRRR